MKRVRRCRTYEKRTGKMILSVLILAVSMTACPGEAVKAADAAAGSSLSGRPDAVNAPDGVTLADAVAPADAVTPADAEENTGETVETVAAEGLVSAGGSAEAAAVEGTEEAADTEAAASETAGTEAAAGAAAGVKETAADAEEAPNADKAADAEETISGMTDPDIQENNAPAAAGEEDTDGEVNVAVSPISPGSGDTDQSDGSSKAADGVTDTDGKKESGGTGKADGTQKPGGNDEPVGTGGPAAAGQTGSKDGSSDANAADQSAADEGDTKKPVARENEASPVELTNISEKGIYISNDEAEWDTGIDLPESEPAVDLSGRKKNSDSEIVGVINQEVMNLAQEEWENYRKGVTKAPIPFYYTEDFTQGKKTKGTIHFVFENDYIEVTLKNTGTSTWKDVFFVAPAKGSRPGDSNEWMEELKKGEAFTFRIAWPDGAEKIWESGESLKFSGSLEVNGKTRDLLSFLSVYITPPGFPGSEVPVGDPLESIGEIDAAMADQGGQTPAVAETVTVTREVSEAMAAASPDTQSGFTSYATVTVMQEEEPAPEEQREAGGDTTIENNLRESLKEQLAKELERIRKELGLPAFGSLRFIRLLTALGLRIGLRP